MITKMNVFGYTIFEPMTAFTDFLLAGICFFFYLKNTQFANSVVKDWGRFFFFMFVSTFLGGVSHACFQDHAENSYKVVWLFMQIFSGLSLVFAQRATIKMLLSAAVINTTTFQKLELFFRIQFLVFGLAVITIHNFTVVVFNSTFGFLTILGIQLFLALKFKDSSADWIAKGILVSFFTAFVFIAKISISVWFNFKDIAHVIMVFSVYLIHNGVTILKRRPVEKLLTN